jgi:hypothetical protein
MWVEYTRNAAALSDQLRTIPRDNHATWAKAATDVPGAFRPGPTGSNRHRARWRPPPLNCPAPPSSGRHGNTASPSPCRPLPGLPCCSWPRPAGTRRQPNRRSCCNWSTLPSPSIRTNQGSAAAPYRRHGTAETVRGDHAPAGHGRCTGTGSGPELRRTWTARHGAHPSRVSGTEHANAGHNWPEHRDRDSGPVLDR